MANPQVGLIGLAVMGSNLAQNIESRGYPVAVFNRTGEVTDEFMKRMQGRRFTAARTLEELVQRLERPRQIIVMVKAGDPTDAVIDALLPLVACGDLVIDCGNAYFKDTIRRERKCRERGANFLGVGVSGGEEGALKGPSIMPGGPREAWRIIAPMLEKIAAKVDSTPCTAYIGPDGAGHFVKMVHNGIEYGDMQLIAEAYYLLREVLRSTPEELAAVFAEWNEGVLSSFLIEITAKIFRKKDAQGTGYLIDQILDKAGQKGTGKWTVQEALDLGTPVPTIAAAVDARGLSALKEERTAASKEFAAPAAAEFRGDRKAFIQEVHDALYCAKIMSYAQGMAMLAAASRVYDWNLRLDEIAALWRGGCIIRARFLSAIRRAFEGNARLKNLMLDGWMRAEVARTLPGLRKVAARAAERGLAIPAFSASLAYFESYRCASLPQNLTQAQRDFFGAHTYERVDAPGVAVHTVWEEK